MLSINPICISYTKCSKYEYCSFQQFCQTFIALNDIQNNSTRASHNNAHNMPVVASAKVMHI